MKIENVIRFKGTIVIGALTFDVKIGDQLEIVTPTEILLARVVTIETLKSHDAAKNGERMALMLRGVMEKTIKPGDIVRMPDSTLSQ